MFNTVTLSVIFTAMDTRNTLYNMPSVQKHPFRPNL